LKTRNGNNHDVEDMLASVRVSMMMIDAVTETKTENIHAKTKKKTIYTLKLIAY